MAAYCSSWSGRVSLHYIFRFVAVDRLEFCSVAFLNSWQFVCWNVSSFNFISWRSWSGGVSLGGILRLVAVGRLEFRFGVFWLRSSWSVGISLRLILLLGGWTVEILLCRVFGFVISLPRVRPRLLFHFPFLIFCCRGRGLNYCSFPSSRCLFSLVRPGWPFLFLATGSGLCYCYGFPCR